MGKRKILIGLNIMVLILFSGCGNINYIDYETRELLLCNELGYENIKYSHYNKDPVICHNGTVDSIKEYSKEYRDLWWDIEGKKKYLKEVTNN